jgi:plastocyanin
MHMRTWRLVAGLAITCLMALASGAVEAGGGGGGGSLCAGFAEGGHIVMRDNCFEGVAQFVAPGSTVTVFNEGGLDHSLTAVDGAFDTGLLAAGQTAEFKVEASGVMRYYCSLHGTASGRGMAGVIIVAEADAPSPSGANAPRPNVWGWLGGGLGGAVLALLIVRFRPR